MKVEYFTAVLLCFALTLSACEINKNHLDAAETRYDITDAGSDTVQAEKSNDSTEPHYDFNTDETGGYKPNNIEIGISACKVEDFYYNVEFSYGNNKYIKETQPVNLLMINGGFVNCGSVFMADGDAYVPAEIFFDVLGAHYRTSGIVMDVGYGETEIKYHLDDADLLIKKAWKKYL